MMPEKAGCWLQIDPEATILKIKKKYKLRVMPNFDKNNNLISAL